jgi:putative transposase
MKAYSLDLRKKIVTAYLVGKLSIRKVADQFNVSKSLVQKLVKQQQTEGNLQSKKRGKPQFSHLTSKSEEVRALVAEHPDATLVELCELFAQKTGNWVSRAAMCRYLQKLELNRKKKHGTVAKLRQKESKNCEWSIGRKSRISSQKT